MKKFINVIVSIMIIVLIALLIHTSNETKYTSQPTQTQQSIREPHDGFERHEDLARAYVDYMIYGQTESLVGCMSKEMIIDIAVENFTNENDIRNALSAWYSREHSYINDWLYETFSNPEEISWHISEIRWSEEEELEDLDYGLGIAGYDYKGLRRLGVSNVLYYGASVSVSDNYGTNDGVGLHFAIAQINGLWYLVGID